MDHIIQKSENGRIGISVRQHEPLAALEFVTWKTDTVMTDIAGLEFHISHDKLEPNRKSCLLLGKPCYHDGTSLWASEYWLPLYKSLSEESFFEHLEVQLKEYIKDYVRQEATA